MREKGPAPDDSFEAEQQRFLELFAAAIDAARKRLRNSRAEQTVQLDHEQDAPPAPAPAKPTPRRRR
jgi:hypothetical protein